MTKHDAARRAFLVRAAAGAGAVAGAGLLPDASGQNRGERHEAPAQLRANAGAFFNQEDAATIEAFTERLMPGAAGKPGAREAGVLRYIDLALAGAYADLQDFYRRSLAQLDAYCRKTYQESFRRLDAARQDEVMTALERDQVTGFTWPSGLEFFNIIRTHTMEGLFADPIYGGNQNLAGWRLVGFPGAQSIFTPADMRSRQAFTREPIIGLEASDESAKGRA